ncbi:hypothetical protein [Sphingomonas soli]|uniref:hypothetical protein n=1 Tax=Sphingomonas soli TaxID=266127 RepID=UPI000836B842|nr:hypothetical protein [Sphingomonas soli]
MMALVYHGTPLSPREALIAAGARAYCVSFFRPDSVNDVEAIAPFIMYDNGAFSYWMQAVRAGVDPMDAGRLDWTPYYEWLADRLFRPGRWAVVPDRPAAPSQINDGLLNEWPFGTSRGAPVWHMDGPLDRLARLCERFDRVCLGWIGDTKREPVGCDAYRRRMDEVAALMGNSWHPLHMLRGVAVGGDYPFLSCDSTSLAQNHHRYRLRLFAGTADEWSGVRAYADKLERLAA